MNETAHLFGDATKPACNLIINFTYPVLSSDELLKSSLTNRFLTACFGDKYMNESPEEAVGKYTDNYIREYRNDCEPTYAENERDDGDKEKSIEEWYSFYKSMESHVQLYEGELLVYRIDSNEYTGGAHGIYLSTFLNIDLTLMRPLRLDDLFVGNYKTALSGLIWEQLMKDNGVSDREALEDLGYGLNGDILPTENFYLNKDGITFYYNVYDIAPYSTGAVSVTIPFGEIRHLAGNSPVLKNLL